MKTIHKFPLAPPFIVPMPADAKVVHLDTQHHPEQNAVMPYLWVELDTDKPYIPRHFMVLGTGHAFPAHVTKAEHIGTLKLEDGKFMIHVYEELETNVH